MHAFAKNYEESAAQALEDGTVSLPKLMIMPATSAANCGVSSIDPIYRLQDGWPVDTVLRNDILINEHCASRWPRRVIC